MSSISMKFVRVIGFGVWSIASMALAGEAKTSAHACYEGGPQGKAVPTAKTQEECQKLGDKFVWTSEHEHKAHSSKSKGKEKAKHQAKSEAKPAESSQEPAPAAAPTTPAPEAPKQ